MRKRNDSSQYKALPQSIVADLSLFAFYIGNESLLLPEYPDLSVVLERKNALGSLFERYIFAAYDEKGVHGNFAVKGSQRSEMKMLVQSLQQGERAKLMHSPTAHENDWRVVIVDFMLNLGNRTLSLEPILGLKKDYRKDMLDYGNALEMLLTILCNSIRIDAKWHVVNKDWVYHRAAQYIRTYHDENYDLMPPFTETEQTRQI